MRTSDDLFQLIKSLSKSEKRYFKLSASIYGGEKNYLRLFDAIDRQRKYDEGALKEKFREERFVRQFNVAKKYLYELILHSLRAYHSDYRASGIIRDLIKSAEILYEKGLRSQAVRLIEKAIGVAHEHDTLIPRLESLRWLATLQTDWMESEAGIDRMFDSMTALADALRNEIEYERILSKMRLATSRDEARTAQEFDLLERCVTHSLMLNEENARTVRSRLMLNSVLGYYHYSHRNLAAVLNIVNRQIKEIEQHPALRFEHTETYVRALLNRMLIHRLMLNLDDYRAAREELQTTVQSLLSDTRLTNLRVRATVFGDLYTDLLSESIMLGEFSRGAELIEEIERGLRQHADRIAPEVSLRMHYQIAHISFGTGDYRRALDHINIVLCEAEPVSAKQVYHHARLFQLILHYELENLDLLPHLVRSTYRYYRSSQIMFKFEASVLTLFRRLTRVNNRQELIAAFVELKNDLTAMHDDPRERLMFNYFHYIEWLDSKIEGRDFVEVVRADPTVVELTRRFGRADQEGHDLSVDIQSDIRCRM